MRACVPCDKAVRDPICVSTPGGETLELPKLMIRPSARAPNAARFRAVEEIEERAHRYLVTRRRFFPGQEELRPARENFTRGKVLFPIQKKSNLAAR